MVGSSREHGKIFAIIDDDVISGAENKKTVLPIRAEVSFGIMSKTNNI